MGIKYVAPYSKEEFVTHARDLKARDAVVGTVSINDITRALEQKKRIPRGEVVKLLPKEIRHLKDLFVDDEEHNDNVLLPHRPGLDTKFNLEKNQYGRDKEVPWGPLYGMSQEELLVLRKTLVELLDKN